jgi:hypothetical protein
MAGFTKKSSDTFKVANLIAIFLVVAIHYNSKHYIDVNQTLSLNYYFQEWFTNSIARIAVPFFGFTAGFFYFLKFRRLSDYWLQLSKRGWSLIVPYIIAVSVIFFYVLALELYKYQVSSTTLSQFAFHFLHPESVQFWFLRDLIVIIVFLCPLLHISISRFPNSILISLLFVWFIELQFFPILAGWYLVNVEVLFFFSVGCFFGKNPNSLERLLKWIESHGALILALFLTLSVSRVIWAPNFAVWYGVHGGGIAPLCLYKLTILTGLPALYVASVPLRHNRALIWLSPFSFFIFLYHIKPVSTFSINIASVFLPDPFLFYLTFPLAVGISILFGWTLKKMLPCLYGYVTGGR